MLIRHDAEAGPATALRTCMWRHQSCGECAQLPELVKEHGRRRQTALPVAQAALEGATERVAALVATSPELQALRRSCANAWGLYRRTRPGASAESVSRARALPRGGLQPLLAAAVPASAAPGLQAQVLAVLFIVCNWAAGVRGT